MVYYEFIIQVHAPNDKEALEFYNEVSNHPNLLRKDFSVLWKIDRKVIN